MTVGFRQRCVRLSLAERRTLVSTRLAEERVASRHGRNCICKTMILIVTRYVSRLTYYASSPHREWHYKMMVDVYLSVRLSVCRMFRPISKSERCRKPKIGGRS